MDGRKDGRIDEQTDGQMDIQTDGRKDGRMDGWTDGRTDVGNFYPFYRTFYPIGAATLRSLEMNPYLAHLLRNVFI